MANVKCWACTGFDSEAAPAVFEPDVTACNLEDLNMSEILVRVPKWPTCCITIPVSNPTKHNITLRRRPMLGKLQLIKSKVPIDVKRDGEMPTTQPQQSGLVNTLSKMDTQSKIGNFSRPR